VDPQAYLGKLKDLAQKRSAATNAKEEERAKKDSGPEKAKAKLFLDKMSKEKGCVKTDSGLLFFSEKEGTGASPKPTDMVKVNYAGTLESGLEFDSSYKRGQPAEFPLNGVVPCWTEALQKMKVGGKAKIVCPSELAYGDRGSPPVIPGGAALVFEVELLDIVKAETVRAAAENAAKEQEKSTKKEEKDAAKFLAKMAKEKGAQKTESGLIYFSEKEGSGAAPKATDTVKVNYEGRLTNGTVFDASSQHGGAATFPLNQVIPCWTEGVQKIKVGGKAKLVCPSAIAYGERGAPPLIPGGATLVFEVELLDIVGAKN
jgi:FKBP-type peptidyl-prolyl cis-trans isomerase